MLRDLVDAEAQRAGSPRASISAELNAQLRRATVARMRASGATFVEVGTAVSRDPSSIRKWVTRRPTNGHGRLDPRLSLGAAAKLAAWLEADLDGVEAQARVENVSAHRSELAQRIELLGTTPAAVAGETGLSERIVREAASGRTPLPGALVVWLDRDVLPGPDGTLVVVA